MKHNGTTLLKQALWPRDVWLAALGIYLVLGLSLIGAVLHEVLPPAIASEVTSILAAIALYGLLILIGLYLFASLFILIYDDLLFGLRTVQDALHLLRTQPCRPGKRRWLILCIIAHPILLLSLVNSHPLITWSLLPCILGLLFYADASDATETR